MSNKGGRPSTPHKIIDGIEMKQCIICKQFKPLDCFSNKKDSKDGKRSSCKECINSKNRELNKKDENEFIKISKDIFHNNESFVLTPRGFDLVVDKYSSRIWTNKLSKNWVDLLIICDKEKDLYEYVKQEYYQFYINTFQTHIQKFVDSHMFITVSVLNMIDFTKIRSELGFTSTTWHTKEAYEINWKNVKYKLGRIPTEKEFEKLSQIGTSSYFNFYFNLDSYSFDKLVEAIEGVSYYDELAYYRNLSRRSTDYISLIEKEGYQLISDIPKEVSHHAQLLCPNGHIHRTTFESFKSGTRCKECFYDSIRGENSPFWKGGISQIQNYLRNGLYSWRKKSIQECNGKCVISGQPYEAIHHLYSFDNILNNALKMLNIDFKKTIYEYGEEMLDKLKTLVKTLHSDVPLGVCLTEDIHKLFHSIYGYGSNTPKQFYEFQENIKIGKVKIA